MAEIEKAQNPCGICLVPSQGFLRFYTEWLAGSYSAENSEETTYDNWKAI